MKTFTYTKCALLNCIPVFLVVFILQISIKRDVKQIHNAYTIHIYIPNIQIHETLLNILLDSHLKYFSIKIVFLARIQAL